MHPRTVRSWPWLALLSLTLPASAQDPLQFLLEGQDKQRGTYQGRLELVAEAGGVAVRHQATYRAGIELLTGTGQRQGDTLEAELPLPPGMTGALGGAAPGPVQLRAQLELADTELKAVLRQGGSAYAREIGQVIESPLGAGPPTADQLPKPESSFTKYKQLAGVPFLRGAEDEHEVDMNDVKQGGLGDCYFMAGLAAVARVQPERIRNMIEDHGDGTYSVFMWRHNDQWDEVEYGADGTYDYVRTALRIRVDGAFPASGSDPAYADYGDEETVGGEKVRELWPMLFEKAYAQYRGSYGEIEGGYSSTPMSFFSAEQVEDHDPTLMTVEELKALFAQLEAEGRPAALGVPKSVSSLGIHGNHYYAYWGLDAQGRVLLYNPWGSSHPTRGLTMEEIHKHTDLIHVGSKR